MSTTPEEAAAARSVRETVDALAVRQPAIPDWPARVRRTAARRRARRSAAGAVAVGLAVVLAVVGSAAALSDSPDALVAAPVQTPPASPSIGLGTYTDAQVTACRSVQLALHAVTSERVGQTPRSPEASAFLFETERAVGDDLGRLTAADRELVGEAMTALNALVIGDEDPPPLTALADVVVRLAERCGEAVPHLLPPVRNLEEARRRWNPTNDPTLVITDNGDGTYGLVRRIAASPAGSHHPSHGPAEADDPLGVHRAAELDAAYLACARERGFDPQQAEVLVDRSDKPIWVKTGKEVPADVHRPCLVRLGGDDPRSTSYGNDRQPG